MRYTLSLIVVVGILSCDGNGPPPPPPPPPTTTIPIPECGENESCQCIDGYERNDEGECVEIPPPPPPPLVRPEDYITIVRAGELGDRCVTSTGLLRELCFYEQVLVWDGIRNPEYALTYCCSELPGPWPLTVTVQDGKCISPEVELNREIHHDLIGYMKRLQEVNKRCPALPRFCGRTNVQRERFGDWRDGMLVPAIEISGELNQIKAWCVNQ